MKSLVRLIVGVLFGAFLSFSSFAVVLPLTMYAYSAAYGVPASGFIYESAAAACDAFDSALAGTNYSNFNVSHYLSTNGVVCNNLSSGGGDVTTSIAVSSSVCPANSSGTTSCTCNSGYIESNGQCVNSSCNAGDSMPVFWTAPSSDYVSSVPSDVCSQGCSGHLDIASYDSLTSSVVGNYKKTGATCTGSPSSSLPAPSSTASSPSSSASAPSSTASDSSTSSSNSNPSPNCTSDCNNVTNTTTNNNTTNNNSVTNITNNITNPSSTASDSSGGSSGSSSTSPSSGASDSGSSGSSGADNGTKPPETPASDEANCGAPGEPACKIDESGTPTSAGITTDALNGELDKRDNNLNSIQNTDDKDTSWGVVPSWFNGSDSCTPYDGGDIHGIKLLVTIPRQSRGL